MKRADHAGAREPLNGFLFQLRRLRIDAGFAFAYLTAALEQVPPAVAVRLPGAQREQLVAEGSVTEDELRAAEESISNGDFTVQLLGHALVGLVSSLTDDDLEALLAIDDLGLDLLYADGKLIGRSSGQRTMTPGWLVDTSQPDRLIPHSREVLAADAPAYAVAFGQAVYFPQPSLRVTAALSPRAWLSETLDPAAVIALIEADS